MTPVLGWTVADPAWLLLLLALPLVAWLRARRGQPVLVIPFAARWAAREVVPRSRLPLVLVNLGLVLLAIALARPQKLDEQRQVKQKGYDIVLAVDVSGSMLAEDYESGGRRMNRLQAIKPILEAFVARRPNDRIGVVAFGGRSYTLAPLTTDHDWLGRQVGRLQVGLVEDGTAVGDALSLAVSRLTYGHAHPGDAAARPSGDTSAPMEDGRRLGGFAILLTDGANNAGAVAPLEAAEIARSKGIPVYTIGAGQEGAVPMPMFDESGRKVGYQRVLSDLDEPTLQQIAAATGGRYFRAADADTIDAAFAAIDAERKIEFDSTSTVDVQELFEVAAWPGLLLLLAGFWLARPNRQEVFA